ncbi:TPA: carbohydrate kinase family protein [Candidatus Bathyarchaeota archaeon]|nr:carbohydrate kinase family protein [Candidatus Bathyarchaeota archaeon]
MLVTCAGILVIDLIAAHLPRVSSPGELTYAPRGIEMHIGGHCGNVSIDLRKLGIQKGQVSATGAVGKDIFGDFFDGILRENGIVTHLQKVSEADTSKDLILVVTGEDRRYHADIGANLYLDPEYVLAVLEEEKPRIFYAGGVGLTEKLDEQLSMVLQKAQETGCITFVDPVMPYMHGWDFIISSMKWIDIFHCNEDEAKEITGKENPQEAAVSLRKKGADTDIVIISLGEKGLIAVTEDAVFEMPAFRVPIIDPTGAGDALCAGIIHGLLGIIGQNEREISDLSEEELANILLEGEAAGAACVTMVGTTTAVTKENVTQILKEQGEELRARCLKIRSL